LIAQNSKLLLDFHHVRHRTSPPSQSFIQSHSIFQLQLHNHLTIFTPHRSRFFRKKKANLSSYTQEQQQQQWHQQQASKHTAYEADLIIGAIHLRSFLRNDDDDDDDKPE
jgi:hypothetical protein